MRILFYYSKPKTYEQGLLGLQLQNPSDEVILLWADAFKEAHEERCDQVYINFDVNEKRREQIIEHWNGTHNKDVFLMPDPEDESALVALQENADEAAAKLEKETAEAEAAELEAKEAEDKAQDEINGAAIAMQKAAEAKKAAEKERAEADAAQIVSDEAKGALDEANGDREPVSDVDDEDDGGETPAEPKTIDEFKAALDDLGVEYPAKAKLPELKAIWDSIPYEDE